MGMGVGDGGNPWEAEEEPESRQEGRPPLLLSLLPSSLSSWYMWILSTSGLPCTSPEITQQMELTNIC